MGCSNHKSTEEAENNKIENINVNKKENQETIEANKDNINTNNVKEDIKEEKPEKKDDKNNKKIEEKRTLEDQKNNETQKSNKNKSQKEEKDKEKKDVLNINSKKRLSDKDNLRLNTEENKDTISNVLTDAVLKEHKLKTHKQQYNGVTLMKGIEECFSEDLNEDEVLQLVEDALGENIIEDKKDQIPGTLTPDQARAVAKIIHKKINKKSKDEDEKNGIIDITNYPELKGVNIEIGVTDLTKDVIRNFLFNGQKVDEYQIDLTYNNLTSSNSNLKALSIQINP